MGLATRRARGVRSSQKAHMKEEVGQVADQGIVMLELFTLSHA